jgi:hypothetical protein
MPLPIENITDEKYGVDGPFRVYYVPEGQELAAYTREDLRQPIDFDGTNKPLVYLQLTKNPVSHKFVPFAVYYDATAYSDEDIQAIPTLPNIGKTCSYCQARNDTAEALGLADTSEQAGMAPVQKVAQTIQTQVQRPIAAQRSQENTYMDLGKVITPSIVPAAIDIFTKVFCEPFGEAIVKIGAAGLASIAAGWAAEGGTQGAWRKISEDIIRDYKVCPTDIPKIQSNVMAMKEALMKDRANIMGALGAGTMKSFGRIAKEHGFDVNAQAQMGFRGSASVSPFKRGSGRAID